MRVIKVESENVDIRSKGENEDHLIAVVGVKDLLVVHSENATIIAKKGDDLEERLIDIIFSLLDKEKK